MSGKRCYVFWNSILLFVGCSSTVLASESKCKSEAFVPVLNDGTLISSVSGGTRTPPSLPAKSTNTLLVLAPEKPALSAKSKPVLYWWAENPARFALKIGTISSTSTQLEVAKSSNDNYLAGCLGIYRVLPGDQGYPLKIDDEYRWSIERIGSRGASNGLSGKIIYREPSPALKTALDRADNLLEKAKTYAREGYWYDAAEILLQSIENKPDNSATERALLLELLENEMVETKVLTRVLSPGKEVRRPGKP